MNFLNLGGSLFIEGVNLGFDHSSSDFLDYLGIQFESSGGDDEVSQIFGAENSFFDSVNFGYHGGSDAHYSIDHLSNSTSNVLYYSEDDLSRIFVNSTDNYKTIAGSVIFGAFADGEHLELKTYYLAEIINYFLGISPVTALSELFANEKIQLSAFPNPFSEATQICTFLPNEISISLEVFDESGSLVREIARGDFSRGIHSFFWNGLNDRGNRVKEGIYFYSLVTKNQGITNKLILMR
jgi:hypothetical protein